MATSAHGKGLPRSLLLSLGVSVSFTLTSWLFALVSYLHGLSQPYSWPYFPQVDRFSDLTNSVERFRHFGKADFFSPAYGPPFVYPAPMALFYRIFLPTFAHPESVFLAFVIVTILVAAIMLVAQLEQNGVRRGVAAGYITLATLFSSVLIFELQRCNLEIIPFIFITSFLYLLISRRPVFAGVMLGGAIALKLYPVILVGLLLTRKDFRAVAATFLSAGFWMVLGLVTETASISESARGTSQGLMLFSRDVAENGHAVVGWDHSAFTLVKLPVLLLDGSISHALHVYLLLAAAAGLLCYGLRVWKLPVFNQITALSIFSVLLPPVSFEYTLMQMFPAFAIFCCMGVRQQDNKEIGKRLYVVALCFGLLFSPLGLAIIHGHLFGGQLKTLVLIFLLVYLLKYPLHDSVLDASPTPAI